MALSAQVGHNQISRKPLKVSFICNCEKMHCIEYITLHSIIYIMKIKLGHTDDLSMLSIDLL